MLPFLASSVRVVKSDGSTVEINGDSSSGDHDEDAASTTSHTGTPSKHSTKHSDSSDGIEVVPIVAIVFTFLYLIIRTVMAPFTQRAAKRAAGPVFGGPSGPVGLSEEEQAVLLKLQRTLTQMERRVESLETILIDQARTKENYGTKH